MSILDRCNSYKEFASLLSPDTTSENEKGVYAKQSCSGTKYIVLSSKETISFDLLLSKFQSLSQNQTPYTPEENQQKAAVIKSLSNLNYQANNSTNCFFRIINAIINLIRAIFCCKKKDLISEILEIENTPPGISATSLATMMKTTQSTPPALSISLTALPEGTSQAPVAPTNIVTSATIAPKLFVPNAINGTLLEKTFPGYNLLSEVKSELFNALAKELENQINAHPQKQEELRSKALASRVVFQGFEGTRTDWPSVIDNRNKRFPTGPSENPALIAIVLFNSESYAPVVAPKDVKTITLFANRKGYESEAEVNIRAIKKLASYMLS